MAQTLNRNSSNVPGAWFCTHPDEPAGDGCIACATCFTKAPSFFAMDSNGNAYVAKQPLTDAEIALCQDQMEACPVGSIGRN